MIDQFVHMFEINSNVEIFHVFSESESEFFIVVVVVVFVVVVVVVVVAVDDAIDIFHFFNEFRKIFLKFFADEQTFKNLKNLIFVVNAHVVSKNYAVILNRTKTSKFKIKKKT